MFGENLIVILEFIMGILKDKLDNNEIKEKLLKNKELVKKVGLTPEDIDVILEDFWFHDFYNCFIGLPEIFNLLENYLVSKKLKKVERPLFYQYILDSYIENETTQNKLFKLGYELENKQTNTLPEKDFIRLYKDFNIEETDIKKLIKGNLDSEKPSEIGFIHHTFQEFLAYKYIQQNRNLFEQSMVLQLDNITAFRASWINVLRFFLESDTKNKILSWFTSFLSKNKSSLTERVTELITFIKTEGVSEKNKNKVFDLIYYSYKEKSIWLPVWSRNDLWKFIEEKQLDFLKKELESAKNQGDKDPYIILGNITPLIGPLYKNKPFLFNPIDKKYWLDFLINGAISTEGNGVLQRGALSSLEDFKDISVLEKVKSSFEFEDSLVKEAFLQLCTEIDADSPVSVEYFVKAIKQDIDIYGRWGLYEIKEKSSVIYFLNQLINDENFLKNFLDKESIFGGNRDKEKTDRILIELINKFGRSSEEIVILLKKVIQRCLELDHGYYCNRSYFIAEIGKTVIKEDSEYLNKIFVDIKNSEDIVKRFVDYEDFLISVTDNDNKNNIIIFLKKFEGIEELKTHIKNSIDRINWKFTSKNESTKETIAIEKKKEAKKIIGQFRKKFILKEQKFVTDVFKFYLENENVLKSNLKESDRNNLKKLIETLLNNLNPKKTEVVFVNPASTRNYKIAPYTHYYGDLLRVTLKTEGKEFLQKFKQKIIDFIPFSYYEDQKTILECIENITDKDLKNVNEIYNPRKNNQARYLLPESYIYIVGEILEKGTVLESPPEILKSFINDTTVKISKNTKQLALMQLGKFMQKGVGLDKRYLLKIFKDNVAKNSKEDSYKLAEITNEYLIKIFKDKYAFLWRFNELKFRAKPFKHAAGFHSVGNIEEELSSRYFSKPIEELSGKEYLPYFIDLLDFTVSLLSRKDSEDYWEYINYLWKIVDSYNRNSVKLSDFKIYQQIKEWFENRKIDGKLAWFGRYLEETYDIYISNLGVKK